MNYLTFLMQNIDKVSILLSPAVVYGVYRYKKFKPKRNDLTRFEVRYKKLNKAIEKKS